MNRRLLLIVSLLLIAMTVLGQKVNAEPQAQNQNKSIYQTGELYIPSERQMEDIDRTITKAKKNNKLVLLAMGANWCHDSRGLASTLNKPEVKTIIDANYEVIYVDVGYLSKVKEVISRFDMPVIYATPTVLVIDPFTEKRINADNMHLWREAATISAFEAAEYFSEIAKNKQSRIAALTDFKGFDHKKLQNLNQTINNFEQIQADRIYKAFSIVGPLVKEKKEGGEAKNFAEYWKAVATFRYTVTDDLIELRKQAREIASSKNSNKKLTFPVYPSFEWE